MVPFSAHSRTLRVTVSADIAGHLVSVSKNIQVHAFKPIIGITSVQLLRQVEAAWVPTTDVHVGENIRLVASYGVTEVAGNFFPPCVSGVLTIKRSGTTVFSAPVQCPSTQPGDSLPYVYVDLQVTAVLGTGSFDAEFSLSYDEGSYGVAHGSRVGTFSVIA